MSQMTMPERLRMYAKLCASGQEVAVKMTPEELEAVATFCDLATEYSALVEAQRKSKERLERLERLAVWAIFGGTMLSVGISQALILVFL